jgi:hypothetical protein
MKSSLKLKQKLHAYSRYALLVSILLTAVFLLAPVFHSGDVPTPSINVIEEESKVNASSKSMEISANSNKNSDYLKNINSRLLNQPIKRAKQKYTKIQVFDRLKNKIWKFKNLKTKKYGNCKNIDQLREQSKSVSYSAKYIEFKTNNSLLVDQGRYESNFLFDEDKQIIYLDVGDNLRESIFSLSGKILFTNNGFKIIHQAKVDDFNCQPNKFQFLEEYDFKFSGRNKIARN